MTAILRFLWRSGINFPNPISADRPYNVPKRGEAKNDFGFVMEDMRVVGQDLKKSTERELTKYGK